MGKSRTITESDSEILERTFRIAQAIRLLLPGLYVGGVQVEPAEAVHGMLTCAVIMLRFEGKSVDKEKYMRIAEMMWDGCPPMPDQEMN